MTFNQRVSRKVTAEVLDLAEQGVIDWESLARDALGWMSEAEVSQFAQHNGYIVNDEDDEADCYEQERSSKYR
jgi:hypothetical protein